MFDLADYSEAVQRMLAPHQGAARPMPLAPRAPLSGAGLEALRAATAAELVGGRSSEWADCVRSALFLYFSALDESHVISQSIPSTTGSFLHGIMHRQEPDFSNSKYWFRRTGRHELFPTLREEALRLSSLEERVREAIQVQSEWDPFWMVDECERAVGGGDRELERSLEKIQRLEWRIVFDYCYRRAQ